MLDVRGLKDVALAAKPLRIALGRPRAGAYPCSTRPCSRSRSRHHYRRRCRSRPRAYGALTEGRQRVYPRCCAPYSRPITGS